MPADPKDTAAASETDAVPGDALVALIGAPLAPGTDASQIAPASDAAADAAVAAAAAGSAAVVKGDESGKAGGVAPKSDAPKEDASKGDASKSAEVAAAKRKLVLGGREIEVEEDAEAAFRREIDARAGRWGSEKQRYETELERLRRENEQLKSGGRTAAGDERVDDDTDDVKPPVEPDDDLLNPESPKYNPTEYAKQNREYRKQSRLYTEALVLNGMRAVEQQRREEAAALDSQRQVSARREAVINRFYTEVAPELNDYREVVGAVYLKHRADLEAIARENPDEAMKALKKLAVARIVKITEAGRIVEAPPTMGTSRRAPAAPKPAPTVGDDEDDGSLGSLIRKSRVARMQRAS